MEITWRFEDDFSDDWVSPLTEPEREAVMNLVDSEPGVCAKRSPLGWICVRGWDHTGPHIATGTRRIFAIWD